MWSGPCGAKRPIAVAALVLAVLLTLFAGIHISLAMVIASVIMILTGCLSIEEAHESIDWRTVFLVAGMLPPGRGDGGDGAPRNFWPIFSCVCWAGWGPSVCWPASTCWLP